MILLSSLKIVDIEEIDRRLAGVVSKITTIHFGKCQYQRFSDVYSRLS